MEKRKLLIVRTSALGDVAMTIPSVYSLAVQNPDLEICYLTRPAFSKLFINPPSNLSVITADFKKDYKGIFGLRRLIARLSRYGFTDVADLHDVLRSWTIDVSMRAKGKRVRKLSKGRVKRIGHLTRKKGQKPYVTRYAEVFERLGFKVGDSFKGFDFKGIEVPDVEKPAIGIAPFARFENKTYPLKFMRQVASMLSAKGYHIYLFGGGEREKGILAEWEKAIPNCVNLTGKYSLAQELKIMSEMQLMITMDSANQHLASLAGVRAITIWGSTIPEGGFLGFGQKREDAVCLYLPCQPCSIAGSRECSEGDMKCLLQICPQKIVDKVLGILQSS